LPLVFENVGILGVAMLQLNSKLAISMREIRFVYGTSTGPGGQHVNKVATKATLLFDVLHSDSLTPFQRNRILTKLSTRINKHGLLRVSSSKHRSQRANKEAATDRFVELLRDAIKPIQKRKKSRVPRASKKKRLQNKKKRGETKRLRGKVQPHD
jgi:ribosome-associated protein